MIPAPLPAESITADDERAADLLWTAIAAGTLYALLTSSDRTRRAQIERLILRHERILRDLGVQLTDGVLSVATWERQTRQALRPLHLAATAATLGGLPLVDGTARAALVAALAVQFGYLHRLAGQLRSAEQLLDATFLARLTLYANAAHSVAQGVQRMTAQAGPWTQEIRRLGVADHCGDCLTAAAQGWVPIGTLPAIGESICITRCRCRFEYR